MGTALILRLFSVALPVAAIIIAALWRAECGPVLQRVLLHLAAYIVAVWVLSFIYVCVNPYWTDQSILEFIRWSDRPFWATWYTVFFMLITGPAVLIGFIVAAFVHRSAHPFGDEKGSRVTTHSST